MGSGRRFVMRHLARQWFGPGSVRIVCCPALLMSAFKVLAKATMLCWLPGHYASNWTVSQ
jgi:hypothetical protein